MSDASDSVQSKEVAENKLYRAGRWAFLGAASGVAVWLALFAAAASETLSRAIVFYAPGTTFGLVIGLALFGLGYARLWQAALFAALSAPAWYAGYYVGVEFGWAYGLYPDSPYIRFFIIGVVGGTVWAIVQTLAVALLSFARRVRPLVTLVAVGAVTAGLLLVAGLTVETEESLFLILWTGWYAVYAAVLSLFLPWPKSEA